MLYDALRNSQIFGKDSPLWFSSNSICAQDGRGLLKVPQIPTRNTEQGKFIQTNCKSIWPIYLAGFTRLLVRLHTSIGRDLDITLVLAVIGHGTRPYD